MAASVNNMHQQTVSSQQAGPPAAMQHLQPFHSNLDASLSRTGPRQQQQRPSEIASNNASKRTSDGRLTGAAGRPGGRHLEARGPDRQPTPVVRPAAAEAATGPY